MFQITGFDPDSGSNGQMTFTMLDPPNREKLFGIRTVSRNMAEVFALQELDRENPESEADFYIVGNQLKYSVIVKVGLLYYCKCKFYINKMSTPSFLSLIFSYFFPTL